VRFGNRCDKARIFFQGKGEHFLPVTYLAVAVIVMKLLHSSAKIQKMIALIIALVYLYLMMSSVKSS